MRRLSLHPVARAVLLALVLALAASRLPSFQLFLVGQLSLVITVTVAMTILMGGAGLLSLSSAAFFAIGAYGLLLMMAKLGVPLLLGAVLAVALCALLGAVLGLVSLRLSGFHLAIITLGFLQVLLAWLKRGGDFTGGGYGLVTPKLSVPFTGSALRVADVAIFAVFLMALAVAAGVALMQSRIGRAWLAGRDNENSARMLGIDVNRMRVLAFTFASALTGLAGTLHPLLLGVTNPNAYTVDLSIFHITLVVVGGMTGSMVGAVVAPILLYFVPEAFRQLGEWRDFFYAGVLIATLVFMRRGIGPALSPWLSRLARRKEAA
ncbi:branched-chain amino acid ABC transporter permease [Ramlibacter sp. G-1-2-2]|uniref:Branched-chain amino acid ABC transporter permease n=1 Tax=Ramlibacter agri TaxID=2728837 RepID=A0A848H914_9BURK|nr:branched-chain amino acid ABC transporter permease [Ramlibacter agri]